MNKSLTIYFTPGSDEIMNGSYFTLDSLGDTMTAFGNTTATQLVKSWNEQNGYLVDYAIGVVTHDDAKAKAAMLTLTGEFVPRFAQQLSEAGGIGPGQAGQLLSPQVSADKAFIDEVFAHVRDHVDWRGEG